MTQGIERLVTPLASFYESGARGLNFAAVEPAQIPEPYRRLLVHNHDMTPTLESYFGKKLRLECLQVRREGDDLYRQVILRTEGDGNAAEWGAIRIGLGHLAVDARTQVLEGVVPLGAILQHQAIEHSCRPDGYLRFASDSATQRIFGTAEAESLYGRHSILYSDSGTVLAEAVEILPPSPAPGNRPAGGDCRR